MVGLCWWGVWREAGFVLLCRRCVGTGLPFYCSPSLRRFRNVVLLPLIGSHVIRAMFQLIVYLAEISLSGEPGFTY